MMTQRREHGIKSGINALWSPFWSSIRQEPYHYPQESFIGVYEHRSRLSRTPIGPNQAYTDDAFSFSYACKYGPKATVYDILSLMDKVNPC